MAKRSRADEDSWNENRKLVFDNINSLSETLKAQYNVLGTSLDKLENSFEKRINKQSDDFNIQLSNITTKLETIKDNDLTHIDERLNDLKVSITSINSKITLIGIILMVGIPISFQIVQLFVDFFKP